MSNKENKLVYLILDKYYEDTDVLGIFSTRKKAETYIELLNPPTGIQTIYEIEIDAEIEKEKYD